MLSREIKRLVRVIENAPVASTALNISRPPTRRDEHTGVDPLDMLVDGRLPANPLGQMQTMEETTTVEGANVQDQIEQEPVQEPVD